MRPLDPTDIETCWPLTQVHLGATRSTYPTRTVVDVVAAEGRFAAKVDTQPGDDLDRHLAVLDALPGQRFLGVGVGGVRDASPGLAQPGASRVLIVRCGLRTDDVASDVQGQDRTGSRFRGCLRPAITRHPRRQVRNVELEELRREEHTHHPDEVSEPLVICPPSGATQDTCIFLPRENQHRSILSQLLADMPHDAGIDPAPLAHPHKYGVQRA